MFFFEVYGDIRFLCVTDVFSWALGDWVYKKLPLPLCVCLGLGGEGRRKGYECRAWWSGDQEKRETRWARGEIPVDTHSLNNQCPLLGQTSVMVMVSASLSVIEV